MFQWIIKTNERVEVPKAFWNTEGEMSCRFMECFCHETVLVTTQDLVAPKRYDGDNSQVLIGCSTIPGLVTYVEFDSSPYITFHCIDNITLIFDYKILFLLDN